MVVDVGLFDSAEVIFVFTEDKEPSLKLFLSSCFQVEYLSSSECLRDTKIQAILTKMGVKIKDSAEKDSILIDTTFGCSLSIIIDYEEQFDINTVLIQAFKEFSANYSQSIFSFWETRRKVVKKEDLELLSTILQGASENKEDFFSLIMEAF